MSALTLIAQYGLFCFLVPAIAWLGYHGIDAILNQRLITSVSLRPSGPIYPMPLYGWRAIVGGFGFLSLGIFLVSAFVSYGPVARYFRSPLRGYDWLWFVASVVLYVFILGVEG